METLSGSRYWEQIINTMSDALVLISPEGRIFLVNRAFEELTGYAAADVVGQSCTMLECDACRNSLQEGRSLWCALFDARQQDKRRVRCTIAHKNGTYLNTIKKASILKDETGRILGAVETMSGISELERLDQKVVIRTRFSRSSTSPPPELCSARLCTQHVVPAGIGREDTGTIPAGRTRCQAKIPGHEAGAGEFRRASPQTRKSVFKNTHPRFRWGRSRGRPGWEK
jgi:PAS domain S-box-containing protein